MIVQANSLKRVVSGLATVVLMLCTLCACSRATPEEKIRDYNAKLGEQGELTKTHLIIRWPGRPSSLEGANPVTLKVPREYLDNPPVFKDDKGNLRWLYIVFSPPGAVPWDRWPPVLKDDPPEKVEAFRKHQRSRVLVIIDRDGGGGHRYRDAVREEGRDTVRFLRDGEAAELERYSRLNCDTPVLPANAELKKHISEKAADDSSPPNCRLDRTSGILTSPPALTRDDEGVAIICDTGTCDAHFFAGQRGARIHFRIEDMAFWQERVESARKLIDSFVVSESAGAEPAPIPRRP